MTEASERFNKIEDAQRAETSARLAAAHQEQLAHVSAIAEVKKDVVDLARRAAASSLGRVTCLLAGTVLTAFY